MTVFNYEIANTDVTDVDGMSDVIQAMHWRCQAKQENCDLMPVASGVVYLNLPTKESFFPFDSITKEKAVEWLKKEIDFISIEKTLQKEIDDFIDLSETKTFSLTSKIPSNWATGD